MKPIRLAVALLVAIAAPVPTALTDTLSPRLSMWRYDATGTDLGTSWRDTTYNDMDWSEGDAILGYGDPFIVTTIPFGPDPNNKYRTAYFRRTFDYDGSAGAISSMNLLVNYDDAFVAYLNGWEIARNNISGTVAYNTLADSGHEAGSYESFDVSAFLDSLVTGSNLLAVEVHQRSISSSDLAMDAELDLVNQSPEITRGPYLQRAGETAVTVRWRTASPSDSRVRYGTDSQNLVDSSVSGDSTTEHEITLTGLTADTQYFYAVGSSGGDLTAGSDYTFRTHPVLGTKASIRAWILGDSGTANSNAAAVRDGYRSFTLGSEVDLWLMLGDNAYNTGTDAEYQGAVFDMYPEELRTMSLWPTRGNHDQLHSGSNNDYYEIFTMPDSGQSGGLASFTEAYYSFDYGNVHFVCLDSEGSDNSPGGAMLTWLANDLAGTSQDWTVAFWHHPPYSKGSHDSDDEFDSAGRLKEMRENALPVLEQAGVDLVLGGHSHAYERSFLLDEHYGESPSLHDSMKVDAGDGRFDGDGPYNKLTLGSSPHEGAVYVVAGSSGKTGGGDLNHPVMIHSSVNQLGSVVLDVNDNRLDARFLGTTGAVVDSFTIIKGTPTGVEPDPRVSAGLTLRAPHPNPFSSNAQLRYRVATAGAVRLFVVDVRGRRVADLIDASMPAGDHAAAWSGTDDQGRRLAPGVYFAVLQNGGEVRTRKLVLER